MATDSGSTFGGDGILDSLGQIATDASSPAYRSPLYERQRARWAKVDHVREGTDALRFHRIRYLPKFESEDLKDWNARVMMTFANDDYAQALTDQVGLVFAEAPKLDKDVPAELATLLEDVDGEGSHWHVFARRAFEDGLHYGHVAIWTDYPAVAPGERPTDADKAQRKLRPYWTLVRATELISWRTTRIGGIEVLTQFVRQEDVTVDDGAYGTKALAQYRVVTQDVERDEQGNAVRLGQIRWQLYRDQDAKGAPQNSPSLVDQGTIDGPERIPLRVCYCGEKFGALHTKPFLYALATTSIEDVQVRSDYAAVMHRCNVPVPVVVGLPVGEKINMRQGIALPEGGSADYLEPKGTAITATRNRLADIGLAMARQGGSSPAGELMTSRTMTATQAAQIARQKNARLAGVARNFQDTLEGALADMAAFMPGFKDTVGGGSIIINQEFAGTPVDPAFIAQVLVAFKEGALLRDEVRYALQHGELPEDTDPETTAAILDAVEQAKADAQAEADAAAREALAQNGAAPAGSVSPADGGDVLDAPAKKVGKAGKAAKAGAAKPLVGAAARAANRKADRATQRAAAAKTVADQQDGAS